jgi:diacylglycerol kinase family enzyme
MALQSLTSPAVPAYIHDIPIVPMGTGNANDLAYMLYDDPTQLEEIFEHGKAITIRPLECIVTVPHGIPERRVAASYVSFGAMAYGAHELNKPEVRNHSHRAAWYGAFVPDFLAVRAAVQAPTFAIRHDSRLREMRDILIGNGERVAKVGKMPARLEKSELYVTMVEDNWLGRSTITLSAIRLALGQLPGELLRDTSFSFTTLEEVPAQFDGEPTYILPESHVVVGHAAATFKALSTKLRKA